MFATHLWVRAAAVMSGGAEEPSPVKAFLSPLNLLEYRDSATCSRSLGPACPGSTARGRDSPGRRPARGRPGVGTHSGSALPRYDIHYESPGVPDPPPSSGFRDRYIIRTDTNDLTGGVRRGTGAMGRMVMYLSRKPGDGGGSGTPGDS